MCTAQPNGIGYRERVSHADLYKQIASKGQTMFERVVCSHPPSYREHFHHRLSLIGAYILVGTYILAGAYILSTPIFCCHLYFHQRLSFSRHQFFANVVYMWILWLTICLNILRFWPLDTCWWLFHTQLRFLRTTLVLRKTWVGCRDIGR
jgi:hypothetical protein